MGSEEDPKTYDYLRGVFFRILISGSVLGGLVFCLIVYWAVYFGGGFSWNDPAGSINIHIVLMTFFMIYLQGHASIIYRILPSKPKYGVKLIHAGLHLTVCTGISIGLAAALNSHALKKSPNFYTLHSWIGITAISFYYIQFLGGFCSFLLPITPMTLRVSILPIHRFLGQNLFTFSIGAALTGSMLKAFSSLENEYAKFPTAGIILNLSGLIILLFAAGIGTLLTDEKFRRRPRPGPEGELLLNDERRQMGGGGPDQNDQAD